MAGYYDVREKIEIEVEEGMALLTVLLLDSDEAKIKALRDDNPVKEEAIYAIRETTVNRILALLGGDEGGQYHKAICDVIKYLEGEITTVAERSAGEPELKEHLNAVERVVLQTTINALKEWQAPTREGDEELIEKIAWEVLYPMVTVDHQRVDIADLIYEYADKVLALTRIGGGDDLRTFLTDWITAYKDGVERNALAETPRESADYLIQALAKRLPEPQIDETCWTCWNCQELNGNDFFICWKCHKEKIAKAPIEPQICPDCIDGKVFNIKHPSTLDECPECKGTGDKHGYFDRYNEEAECHICHGTGKPQIDNDMKLTPEEIQNAVDSSYGWDAVEIIPTEAGLKQREFNERKAIAQAAVKKAYRVWEQAAMKAEQAIITHYTDEIQAERDRVAKEIFDEIDKLHLTEYVGEEEYYKIQSKYFDVKSHYKE